MTALFTAFPCLYVILLVVAVVGLVTCLQAVWSDHGSCYQDIYRKDRR